MASPLSYLASRLECLPWFDYKAHVLSNYNLIDRGKDFDYSNIKIIREFTGLESEVGFVLTHVMISSKSSKLITLIESFFNSFKNGSEIVK